MRVGFIGIGNMGGTLAAQVCRTAAEILVACRTPEKLTAFAEKHRCRASNAAEIAQEADMIFLCVKPQQMAALFQTLAPMLAARKDRFVLISIAAGMTLERLGALSGGSYPILRLMPNTPARVGAGMLPYCANDAATAADCALLCDLLQAAGRVEKIDEAQMDAVSALSGCGPAFVYLFIEALADAGVACGLTRAAATDYAAQTVLGSAKMVMETHENPAALKDAVCSPGGSTIAGVLALDENGFRAAAEKAVLAAFARTKALG